MQIRLVADRFLPLAAGAWLDLATGDRAWLRVEPLAAEVLEPQWLDRCATLAALWHPLLAECLDFGAAGSGHRFEAYRARCDLPAPVAWRRRSAESRRAVADFLGRCGVPPGALTLVRAGPDAGSLVVPGPIDSASPKPVADGGTSPATRLYGVRLIARAALDAVVERLRHESVPGVVVTEIAAAPRSGGRTLLRHCAREARRMGFLVLGTPALGWLVARTESERREWDEHLMTRHVVLLHDARQERLERMLAAHILRLGPAAGRTHHVIQLVRQGAASATITLEPLTEPELLQALVVGPGAPPGGRIPDTLVARSRGRPGMLLATLNRQTMRRGPPRRPTTPYVVHEARAPFHAGPAARGRSGGAPAIVGRRREARSDLSPATLGQVQALAGRGRHAAACRLLRHVEGEQGRRGSALAAGEAAMAAGAILVARGRIDDANDALQRAERHLAESEVVTPAAITAVLLGIVRLAQAELSQSEAYLRAAAASARLAEEPGVYAWALSALADTLWWRGRFEEALSMAGLAANRAAELATRSPLFMVPAPPILSVTASAVASRACLALGDPETAARHVESALERAGRSDVPAARARAQLARARWCASLSDVDGLCACVSRGLREARTAHGRLTALELRITLVEGLTRAGRSAEARSAARVVLRFLKGPLPQLLRLHAQLAAAIANTHPEAAALRRTARRLGLASLDQHVQAGAVSSFQRPAMLNDVIEVMRICQDHDDGRAALVQVAELLRERSQAAAVGWLIGGAQGTAINVPPGRPRFTAGQRAIDCGLAIAPHAVNDGTEAAVAVRAGGVSIGALQCRWTSALPVDAGRLMALLSAVAAAAAGCVRALHEPAAVATAPLIEAELLGVSPAMQQVRHAVARAADAPFSVVIYGESGSGKELVARAIHRAGVRRARPFCALNCAALPDDLMEAELFGHARGAFTGALTERRGLFEEADGGVLFLDELGELSARGQAKLLRALQEGEIRRLGETVSRRVDVRIVAATNRALAQDVEAGRFRRDLWYRLDVIRIAVPPLRERPEDIPVLIAAFWPRAAERVGSRAVLADRTVAALARYDWPGNVRELQNVLAALAVSAARRGTLGPAALPATLAGTAAAHQAVTLEEARRVFEMRFVRAALARAGGHRGRAAAELGLTRQGLAKLMGRLGVEAPELRPGGEARFE